MIYSKPGAPATMPLQTRLWLHSSDPSDAVLLSIFYTSPFKLELEIGGRLAPRVESYEALELAANPAAGTYLFDPQLRLLTVVLRGNAGPAVPYDLLTRPVVQLTIRMETDLEFFFGERVVENIALLLGIPPSSIRIVEVRRGSVIARFEIVDSAGVQANETQQTVERLRTVSDALVDSARNGSLQAVVPYRILQVSITPASADGSAQPIEFDNEASGWSWLGSSAAVAVLCAAPSWFSRLLPRLSSCAVVLRIAAAAAGARPRKMRHLCSWSNWARPRRCIWPPSSPGCHRRAQRVVTCTVIRTVTEETSRPRAPGP
jgi:hypothetical protein